MTQFVRDKAGSSEAEQKKALAYLFAQDSTGLATDGVLTGLAVTQTATASAAVQVAAGSAVVQDSVGNGASFIVNDSAIATLDVLTANPMGGVPRNDIVVFDAATISSGSGGVRAIIGTPNASPTDPTVPATAVPLARLRHAASATTIPSAKIDDLRVYTSTYGGTRQGKRMHWGAYTVTTTGAGVATVTHGAPFTPTAVVVTPSVIGLVTQVQGFGASTFTFNARGHDGAAYLATFTIYAFLGE
jgi:hypothetical protein